MLQRTLPFLLLLASPLLGFAQNVNPQQLLRDVQVLSADSMQGRLPGSAGSLMAQRYVMQRFKQIGLKSFGKDYKQPFQLKTSAAQGVTGTNLVGYLPGKSDKAIVLTAHYDHVGVRNNQIYNGADDNASGVGGLLALATYFAQHQPKHTLIFVALDAEEKGLQGAHAFLENPPLPLPQILLNVNMDMLGINGKGELYASGSYHTPSLKKYLQQIKPLPHAKLVLGHDRPEQGQNDWTSQSDHFQFHKRGIPYVYFGVEDHPHYHQPTDDYTQINQTFYPDAVQLILNFVKQVDQASFPLKARK